MPFGPESVYNFQEYWQCLSCLIVIEVIELRVQLLHTCHEDQMSVLSDHASVVVMSNDMTVR